MYGSGSANFWIRKNANTYINGTELTGVQTNATMEECNTVVSLNVDDTISVWVRNVATGVLQTTNGPNTTFSGYLITAL
jgi:hypothetical protein